MDDFGSLGRAYREPDEKEADHETVIGTMLTGQSGKELPSTTRVFAVYQLGEDCEV